MQAWEYVKIKHNFDIFTKDDIIHLGCPMTYGVLPKPDYCNKIPYLNDKSVCQKCWEREVEK